MREVFLTLFLLLVWISFADFGMQLDLSPNLVRSPMKLLPSEIQKQMQQLQTEPGWKHKAWGTAGLRVHGMGYQGASHHPEKHFGCEASTLQEQDIKGSRSGA